MGFHPQFDRNNLRPLSFHGLTKYAPSALSNFSTRIGISSE